MTKPDLDDELYREIGRNWLHYISWREKIFAGYLTALAALAVAFLQNNTGAVRSVVFAFGILVSAVFRILDSRTTGLVNLCQLAGDYRAGSQGFYGELNWQRFGEKRIPSWHRMWISHASYGLAINVLVASVSALSLVGCFVELWRCKGDLSLSKPAIVILLAVAIFAWLQRLSHNAWSEEHKVYKKRIDKTLAWRPPFLS
jgi:hypothetical protein